MPLTDVLLQASARTLDNDSAISAPTTTDFQDCENMRAF